MIKQFEDPHFLREPSLSTNPLNSEQYFHDSPLCPNFKYENPPPTLILGGKKTIPGITLFPDNSTRCGKPEQAKHMGPWQFL